MSKVVGIDLGTTNSGVCVMEGGAPQVIPNREGARTTPSVVAFTSRGEVLVGQVAKRQALTNPRGTVFGVKRLMGRRFRSPEVQRALRYVPYDIVEAETGDAWIRVDDQVFRPPEIEAIILRYLKRAAEDYLREPVEEAIVSVPAYFNDAQRQATRDAGAIAGLHVSRILNEATAASLAYGMAQRRRGKVAVYDLGGGTFDVSIVEIQDGIYQVFATAGDTYLGGVDFDELIVRWMADGFAGETGIDLAADPMAIQRLHEAAEKAKCELSTQPQAEIFLPFLSADKSGPKHLNAVLTRGRFEEMIQPMLQHTRTLCERALEDAGLHVEDIDEVIPVGGQTRTPAVLRAMKVMFQKEPRPDVNPDEAVAIGTAIQTGILRGEVMDLVLLDVTAHTLGIETKDGKFSRVIDRNSNIPTKQSRLYTTTTDGRARVVIHVLQGESSTAGENTSLGRFRLEGLARQKAGEPEIEVTFEIDINGIVRVAAVDQKTGSERGLTVHPPGGLTEQEIQWARARIANLDLD